MRAFSIHLIRSPMYDDGRYMGGILPMKRLVMLIVCLLFSSMAAANSVEAVRKQAVGSMLVTGWIKITPAGAVDSYQVDKSSEIPSTVLTLLQRSVPGWKFRPVAVAGHLVEAKARMSVRVMAKPIANERYSLSIVGAQFGQNTAGARPTTDSMSYKHKVKVSYPYSASSQNASGTVYVVAQVNRQGQVEKAWAQQVNLRFAADEGEMRAMRSALARASLKSVKQWTFNMPTTGPDSLQPYQFARIPIAFSISNQPEAKYGQWDVYVPGPIQAPPGLFDLPSIPDRKLIIANVDATPPGGELSMTGRLQMITKLDGS